MALAFTGMNLTELAQHLAPQTLTTAQGGVAYRRAGAGPAMVLLHGIGSGSGSWVRQLQGLQASCDVLAWDAPGYGQSSALSAAVPMAADYGQRVWDWLDALLPTPSSVTLVGHSLGAIMAAAAAGAQPQRVRRLVLLSPAAGYGLADPAVREAKLRDRLDSLHRLGPHGMAQRRGAAMLSPAAAPDLLAYVQTTMSQVHPAGYAQAAQLLAHADLASLLRPLRCPVVVASGADDGITPAAGCQALAQALGTPYVSLGAVGHACALEAASAVNALLLEQVRA